MPGVGGFITLAFDVLLTNDRLVIFAYHCYPSLRLTYKPNNHRNIHVRGYPAATSAAPAD